MTTSPTLATKTMPKEDRLPSKNIISDYETSQILSTNFGAMVTSYSMNNTDQPGKGLVHYIMNPRELREDHPVWHYFYLCTLIFVAFVSLFIGPVIFGMLAAIGGIGTPLALSFFGSAVGLILGVVFGVVFSVVCIVALVRILGLSAEWVLDTLWYGGNDLLEISRQQVLALLNIPDNSRHNNNRHHQHQH
ncbi:20846_t:CDS:2 [Dentiscutata erythropus]|uniref:20846_t:CDS:1 n=1 Tax=Dentiscutata erythropus TaxID=1348616 RepID=A0A9N9NH52_9GLOM|nr:20846_t:CDS:2 [Dentiscutata erythropus]